VAYTTPRTWVAGEFVDEGDLNEQLRDNLNAAFPVAVGAWTSWTPTLTQSGAVTKTVDEAKYMKVGRIVHLAIDLSVTGSGSASNVVEISNLPFAAAAANAKAIGVAFIFDASAADNHTGIAFLESTTQIRFLATRVSGVLGTQQFTAALASGDAVRMSATYEAAS